MEVMWLAISVPIMEIEREQQGAKENSIPMIRKVWGSSMVDEEIAKVNMSC